MEIKSYEKTAEVISPTLTYMVKDSPCLLEDQTTEA